MSRSGIMLCYPFTEDRLRKWSSPFLLQPKLDGERCRALVDAEGNVKLLSSEEHTIISVPHINKAIESLHLRSIELDGELYVHGADFSTIHSIVSRREHMHPDSIFMEFHVFDIVNEQPQIVRNNDLIDTIPNKRTGRSVSPIQIVPTIMGFDLDDVMSALDSFISAGYEGVVVRNMYTPYVRKRSTYVMKFKPRKEDIYEILGTVEEVSIEGVPKNALGALVCRGNESTSFSVGSGSLLTRENREDLWKIKETLVGKYARVKYQHLTSAQGVPRFPVIIEIMEGIC